MKETRITNFQNWRGRIFAYAPLLFWIGIVLFLSTSQASMPQTSRIIRPLLLWLFPAASEDALIVYHNYIRKFAHFAEYAVLAFFASRAFASSSLKILQKYWFVFSFLLVVIVALIDETNQSFLASRTGSIWDMALDAAGGLTMILILALYRFFAAKRNH